MIRGIATAVLVDRVRRTAVANMSNYEQEHASFTLTVPEFFNFGSDVVDKWAEEPSKLAMLWVDDAGHSARYTFADIRRESNRFASVLQDLGVRQGDGVMLVLPRLPEWHSIVVGSTRPGWVAYDAAMATARETFTPALTRSTDPAIIYFTSGTTGGPKMVLHTQASYPLAHLVTGKYWLDLQPGDLHWNLSDTGWAKAAYSNLFGPWRMGAAVFIQHSTGRFDAQETLRLLAQHGITTFCAPPTAYRMMVLEDLQRYNLAQLRHCVGAGEPLNPEVIAAWKAGTGLTIYDGYGQTETTLLVANYPCLEVKPGSMGKPVPGFDVAIIEAHSGTVVPPGQEGDIAIRVQPQRPVGLFQEYWKNPEETAHSFRGEWYITGDRGLQDAEGYFWFV